MSTYHPIREIPPYLNNIEPGDTLVVFGELFQRGYANGVVDYAKSLGMNIVYSTVGRRDPDLSLRALNQDEIKEKDQPLINIPLEAGFDLDPDSKGKRPVDQLKEYGLTGWEHAKLDWTSLNESRESAKKRFTKACSDFMKALEPHLTKSKKVLFLHTMAGGFPRAKVVMPIANKVFKGAGDRYQSSEVFWKSEIGKLCDINFKDVTAETFNILVAESTTIRKSIEARGGQVSYLAFGYHGNEVLIGQKYKWYSYSPYLQGWAKCLLEDYAGDWQTKGVNSAVYNVPEILTNSSSIFLGVEVVLYRLLKAMMDKNLNHPVTQSLLKECEEKLSAGFTYRDVDSVTEDYLGDPEVFDWPNFEGWPQHNNPTQMAKMRDTSTKLIEMHKDRKDLMTATLSEVVFRACGLVMLRQAFQKKPATMWIGHDLVADCALKESLIG